MITANEFFKCSLTQYEKHPQKGIFGKFKARKLPLPITISDDEPLMAYVNHGRWIVKCECGGAEKAWEEGLFMCQSCWNGKHKHQYRRAVFPEEREMIEELLLKRALPNRNWFLHETIADLERENEEHKEELL